MSKKIFDMGKNQKPIEYIAFGPSPLDTEEFTKFQELIRWHEERMRELACVPATLYGYPVMIDPSVGRDRTAITLREMTLEDAAETMRAFAAHRRWSNEENRKDRLAAIYERIETCQ